MSGDEALEREPSPVLLTQDELVNAYERACDEVDRLRAENEALRVKQEQAIEAVIASERYSSGVVAETAALKQAITALCDEHSRSLFWQIASRTESAVPVADLRALLEPTPEGDGK